MIATLAALASAGSAAAQSMPRDVPLIGILEKELRRNFEILQAKADPKPYFISYAITEQENWGVSASLGAILSDSASHRRYLDVSVRVGSPELDNYHRVQGETPQFTGGVAVPLDDNPDALRRRVWLETDRVYRLAAQRLIDIKTRAQVKLAAGDKSNDFSREEPVRDVRPPGRLAVPKEEWAARARKLSALFSRYPLVISSTFRFMAQQDTRTLLTTEGTRIQHGRGYARVVINAQAKAADGMNLGTGESFEAESPAALPAEAALEKSVQRVAEDLTALLRAPAVEPFVGPAILSGRAAGVFFHEIFGHRVEGHRQKDDTEGQTFTRSVGSKVLPEFLSVAFDPTLKKFEGTDLNGWYAYDDEGVRARRVNLVEKGILKTFLLSRSPVEGFPNSNGHGRRQPGKEPIARQSNLIVESTKSVPEARLREMLIEEIRRQKKPYGYYFEHVTGGFTTTGRRGLQAFSVIPLVVYRIYPDGRPDELVRGVDIVGTPLASFAKILATSDRRGVFNGYCGAESGPVPVAAVSPALLVSEIEIQKKELAKDRPPLLPRPEPDRRAP